MIKTSYIEQTKQIRALLKSAISTHMRGNKGDVFYSQWEENLTLSTLSYTHKQPFFESNADAERALKKLKKKYSNFEQEAKSLRPLASVILNIASGKQELKNIEDYLISLEDLIDSSIDEVVNVRSKLKELGIPVAQANKEPLDTLISTLFEIYSDLTEKPIQFSYDSAKDIPTGPLYKFIEPFILIFEPNIESRTLLKRMQHINELKQKKDSL